MSEKRCPECHAEFEITPEDRAFLNKLSPVINGKTFTIPDPTLCPDCRQQRRAAQINERNLYKRTCDFSGKNIISNFHPASPYKVYDQKIWYSDAWDPCQYGRDFDFSRPFFKQFAKLAKEVPYPNLFTGYAYDENSEYTNYAGKNKNCYLVFDSDENRDCYYSYSLNGSKDCLDCFRVRQSERCYECIDSLNCYNSFFLQECLNCSDSAFLKNCIGCKNCLMCTNLKNKEYYIENKPVSKEFFEQCKEFLKSYAKIKSARKRFEEIKKASIQREYSGVQNENVSGNYLTRCKNAHHCFDGVDLWDCHYVFRAFMPVKDAMDCEAPGAAEKMYECSICAYSAFNMHFSANCLDEISDILYSSFCFHSSNLFGCVGMNRKKYCILNKQYTKEEYEQLVPKIIDHMVKTGEWGEFFPITLSPFAYNESVAMEYFPLTKEEVLKNGWQWREEDPKPSQETLKITLPDTLETVTDDITEKILTCETSGKGYKVIPQELALYRQLGLPLPRQCPDERHKERMQLRNPRKLWDRKCGKCQKEIQTTWGPERREVVYCEGCYVKEVY